MEKLIACCGLNCATCDARIATMANDDELRLKTAEKWKAQYNVQNMLPEMINCTGCREEGVKLGHCSQCEIRKCAISNNFKTCADCEKLGKCLIVDRVLQYVPEALENLKSLN
jgi:hypothetical protein